MPSTMRRTMDADKQKIKSYYNLPTWLLFFVSILNIVSKKMTTNFLWYLFTRPLKFKTPSRELNFYNKVTCLKFYSEYIQKNIEVYKFPQKGIKVLFIHGWSGRGSQFYKFVDYFIPEGYDITVFDLPAHGKSESNRSNLPEFTDIIRDLEKNQGPFDVVIGHSMGALACLNSIRLGASFEKVVLISLGAYRIDPIFTGFIELFNLPSDFYVERMFKKLISEKGKNPIDYGPEQFVSKIKNHTLLIHCEDDMEANIMISESVCKDMENGKLFKTKGLGHRKILGDEEVIERIIKFIEEDN